MGSNNNGKANHQPEYCVGGPAFRPSQSLKDRDRHDAVLQGLRETNDLERAIKMWFYIEDGDKYVYHASTSVKLSQVQRIIEKGGEGGLHAWYWVEKKGERQPLPPPPATDIESYISIFLPTTATASALRSFASNAKRSSIRSAVASYLISKRFIDPSHPLYAQLSSIPKTKAKAILPCNPYLDFWAWSCHALQWCGPLPIPPPPTKHSSSSSASSASLPAPETSSETPPEAAPPATEPSIQEQEQERMIMPPHKSHPLLAIYMHHFGCAIPTHESLAILKLLSQGRTIADVGSGNGYWTMMLRAYGASVIPIDSAQSEWRVNWLDHDSSSSSSSSTNGSVGGVNNNNNNNPTGTVIADGAKWLSSQASPSQDGGGGGGGASSINNPRSNHPGNKKSTTTNHGLGTEKIQKVGKDLVILIVYPVVGPNGTGNFTRSLMAAYAGDTVAVVGTQNYNGYTGFKGMTMGEYMEREHGMSGWQRVVQIPLPSFPGKDEALFVFQRKG